MLSIYGEETTKGRLNPMVHHFRVYYHWLGLRNLEIRVAMEIRNIISTNDRLNKKGVSAAAWMSLYIHRSDIIKINRGGSIASAPQTNKY